MTLSNFGVSRAPASLLFGAGQRFALGAAAAKLGKRALVCTDDRFSKTQEMKELRECLEVAGIAVEIFSDTEAELPIEGIRECAKQFAEFAPEVIIGIGGGSCLDLAKLVSLLLSYGGDLSEYYGELKVPGPVIPVIAIPTTAGTGSEVTPVAVLGDAERDLKVGISSPYLIPAVAICDPELTLTCPPGLTAIAGSDALTHAIEAFTAKRQERSNSAAYERVFVGKNDLSDYQALAAIKAISSSLQKAVSDGSDLEARSQVMYGSVLAGLAFGTAGTAAAHAIQYPVGALTKTAHGLGVAALMPYVMRHNRSACIAEFAQIAKAMGATGDDVNALADEAIVRVDALFRSIRIPRTLKDLGLNAERLEWVAEKSMLSARLVNNNPVPLSVESMRDIVTSAFNGQ